MRVRATRWLGAAAGVLPLLWAQAQTPSAALVVPWGAGAECPALMAALNADLVAGGAEAHRRAADLYEQGRCLPPNETQAMSHLIKAARQGDAAAARRVALRFARGRGVPQSYATAGAWLAGKGVSDEPLEPWDYSIGYAHAVAGAALDAVLYPVEAIAPDTELTLVLEVQAQQPQAAVLRLTGERSAAKEALRSQLAAAFQVAVLRAVERLQPVEPSLLVPARVALPFALRLGEPGRIDVREQEPVLR